MEAGILEPQTCLKNTLVHSYLHCKNSSGQVLSFLKVTSSPICLACFTGKSSDNTVSHNQRNIWCGKQDHKTLSPDIYFHRMIQCVIEVSLYSSETAGKCVFLNLGMGLMAKEVFSPSESWIVARKLDSCRKTHWFIFLFCNYNNSFHDFEFSKIKRMLPMSCR